MSANELLPEAAKLGLRIVPDGTNLRIRPGRLCPPDFAAIPRTHKPKLLALLANAAAREVVKPHRMLTQHEWAILMRAGAENDPIIFEALRLFNARVVG
jgi:hypothetical protein